MSASAYLSGAADLEQYGVPLATPTQIIRASLLIDHYLRRPEGCVWMPDANNRPAYMASKAPSLTLTSATTIAPGNSIVVPVPGYLGDSDALIGETVVLDRGISTITEVCTVTQQSAGQMTFKSVQFLHTGSPTPITLEFGMAITEEHSLPSQRSVTKLSQWPVARLLSGLGRYGYGRKTEQGLGYFYDMNLLSTVSAFGGPPSWSPFETPSSSLSPESGDIWVPAGQLLSYYTDIKMRYVAGWSVTNLPTQIKVATSAIIDALDASPMGPQIRRFNAGKTNIERFADSVMDKDIKSMLRPFMANWMV